MDDVYDKVYKTLRDERLRSVRCRSMKLLREFLQTEYRQPDNRHILATCYLTLREPNAVRVIERLDADSKFFRSLCALVLTVLTVLPMYGMEADRVILLMWGWPFLAWAFKCFVPWKTS